MFHKQTAKRRKIGHYFLPGGGRKGVGRIWADPPSISPGSYVIPKILCPFSPPTPPPPPTSLPPKDNWPLVKKKRKQTSKIKNCA